MGQIYFIGKALEVKVLSGFHCLPQEATSFSLPHPHSFPLKLSQLRAPFWMVARSRLSVFRAAIRWRWQLWAGPSASQADGATGRALVNLDVQSWPETRCSCCSLLILQFKYEAWTWWTRQFILKLWDHTVHLSQKNAQIYKRNRKRIVVYHCGQV